MIKPIDFYSPETTVFPTLGDNFAKSGVLDPMALYLILDWKSPRARTRHRDRLIRIAGSFNEAVSRLAAGLHTATDAEQQLGFLLTDWEFKLPTASAILAVLYPETFTVYDIRVCDALGDFHRLGNMNWSPALWQEYQRFLNAVRDAAPQCLTLRDCDRTIWGQNKRDQLLKELA